jgi:hypothetical protein
MERKELLKFLGSFALVVAICFFAKAMAQLAEEIDRHREALPAEAYAILEAANTQLSATCSDVQILIKKYLKTFALKSKFKNPDAWQAALKGALFEVEGALYVTNDRHEELECCDFEVVFENPAKFKVDLDGEDVFLSSVEFDAISGTYAYEFKSAYNPSHIKIQQLEKEQNFLLWLKKISLNWDHGLHKHVANSGFHKVLCISGDCTRYHDEFGNLQEREVHMFCHVVNKNKPDKEFVSDWKKLIKKLSSLEFMVLFKNPVAPKKERPVF